MKILGISALYHDSAAALVVDGRIVAAAQEERFSRIKHDPGFPEGAMRACLAEGGLKLADIDRVVFYDKPFLKFERLLETYLGVAPAGYRSFAMSMPVWLREKLFQKDLLIKALRRIEPGFEADRLRFTEHHVSHAASAFFPSPFREAAVLTVDGVGEWATTTIGLGRDNRLDIRAELHFPHSLGLLYSAFTYYCGFRVNSGEYKLMGLAPYGEPSMVDTIRRELIDLREDGSFRLNQDYFDYCTGLTMTNQRFAELFGRPARRSETAIDQFYMDMAASVQQVTEEAMFRLVRHAVKLTGSRNLCMAGGVALNCVANGKLLTSGLIDDLFVQPAAGDAGGALGAALAQYYAETGGERPHGRGDLQQGSLLGPGIDDDSTHAALKRAGAVFTHIPDEAALIERTVEALTLGRAVGWVQGRMEYGPRALGNRSILADPRDPEMQRTLNLKIKYRESFRPFAPVVLEESVADWFELDRPSPYMLLVAPVRVDRRGNPASAEQASAAGDAGFGRLKAVGGEIPAVTHVDGSARVQTVDAERNPRFYQLLRGFGRATGCPVLANTSFNIRGEPIVANAADAYRCFMGCELDVLVVGNYWLDKAAQPAGLRQDYRQQFALD